MTIPGNMSLVTIQGRFIYLDGTPMSGSVSFAPSPAVILNRNAEVIISGSVFTAPLDATGFFSIDIPATDDPDLNPVNFTYRVQEPTGRTYSISAPLEAGVIDLIDVQQVPNDPGRTSLLLRGVGIESMEIAAGDLLVYYTDGTSQNLGPLPGGGGGVSDHGALTGLSDDDHPQYLNQARGDTRYSQLGHKHGVVDINATGSRDTTTFLRGDGSWAVPPGSGSGGVTDHGALTGLTDDDHPQYLNQARGDARYQPLDSDLTQIAGLAAADDSILQRKTGAWSSRTPAQVKTDLALTKADVGLGNVDNTSDANKPVSAAVQAALDGKSDDGHTHPIAEIEATGTRDDTTFLRGDGTWAQPPSGGEGGGVTDHGALTGLTDDDHPQYHTDARGDARYYTKSQVDTAVGSKADDAAVVHDTGDETIAGVKTFSSTPITSALAPTLDSELTRKDYVDDAVATRAPATHTHAQSDVTGLEAALSGKEPSIAAGTTAQYWRGDKSWQTLNKAAVGLSNVDNTSDANKPVSTATQTALNGKANASHTHGIADLNVTGTPSDSVFLRGDGTWAPPPTADGGVTDHGALTGLTDDDHPQYLTASRGDTRYYTQSQIDASLADKANTADVVLDTGDQTIAGVKTFSSTPITTVAAPSAANHLTRKDYVDTQVASRAAASHTHAQSDVTGLTTALSGKQDTSAKNQPNGYAGLDALSKIDGAQIPFGTAAGTAVEGNDARLTPDQAPGTASIRTLGTGAQQAAAGDDARIVGAQQTSQKGQANGYAGLDGSSKVPIAQLPTGTTETSVAIGNDARIVGAQQTSQKGQANGYAGLDASTKVPIAQLPTGTTATSVAIGNDTRFVPAGGAAGQVLRKAGAADYALEWANSIGGVGGVLDCSSMTLASEINAATLSAPFGTQVWLGPRGSGSELGLDTTLILRPGLQYVGCGGLERLTRLKVVAGFTAGQPLVAAQGYMNNATVCDGPTALIGVDIDGDSRVGSHGVVIYNFRALVDNVQVHNIAGTGTADSAAAFLLTDRGINGTTITTNSHSENRFHDIRVDGLSAGASNFVQRNFQDPVVTGGSNMDGHLIRALFAGGTGSGRGLYMDRAAGWTIRDCHFYNVGDDAVRLHNCYATDLTGIYIEGYGLNDAAGINYHGVRMEFLNGRGSTLSDVKVSSSQPESPAAGRFANFYLLASSGQTRAMVSLVGCHSNLSGRTAPAATPKTQAWRFGESTHTGRMLYVSMAGCVTDPLPGGFLSPARFIHSTASLSETTNTATRTENYASSITIDPAIPGGKVDVTATGDITSLNVSTSNAFNRQAIEVAVLASLANRNVTVANAVRTSTGVTRGPFAVPSGQILILLFRYSSLIGAWTLVAVTTSAS